jgi:hypothetical protein
MLEYFTDTKGDKERDQVVSAGLYSDQSCLSLEITNGQTDWYRFQMDIALLKIDADENSLTQHLGIPIL